MAEHLATTANPSPTLPTISLKRQQFQTPARHDLPSLDRYAYLEMADGQRRVVGATEATRGCKHTCRHCPIVPVYGGQFRVVQRAVVLADIRNQVAAGAEHITFGDPDFFNGPGHAMAIVEALHTEFPTLTYDVTIKVEHLRRHAELLPTLRETGCLFVTSAVEAVDDAILRLLDKGHTRADFVKVVQQLRDIDLAFNPTFVAFNPWITLEGYRDLLRVIAELALIDNVAPIQYVIRLLITAQSPLLALPSISALVHPFDEAALVYPWNHPDPQVDALQQSLIALVEQAEKAGKSRREIFALVWEETNAVLGTTAEGAAPETIMAAIAREKARFTPKLSEPWYC
ncbi:MAG: radical SAM protein [Caldilineaceae bacterium]